MILYQIEKTIESPDTSVGNCRTKFIIWSLLLLFFYTCAHADFDFHNSCHWGELFLNPMTLAIQVVSLKEKKNQKRTVSLICRNGHYYWLYRNTCSREYWDSLSHTVNNNNNWNLYSVSVQVWQWLVKQVKGGCINVMGQGTGGSKRAGVTMVSQTGKRGLYKCDGSRNRWK